MTFTRSIATFLLAGVLIQASHQACLTSAQLAALGFTASANATTSTSVCTDLFANGGGCVSDAQLNAAFNTNAANLQVNANLTNSLSNALTNSIIYIQNFLNTASNITTNASVSTAVANSSASLSTYNNIAANARSAQNTCFQNYQNVVNGIYCYLTSNQATNNTVITANGNNYGFNVAVNTTSVGSALATCLPLIDAYCSVTYGISISSTSDNSYLDAGAYAGTSGNTYVPATSCRNLRTNYNCTTAACNQTIYTELITNVFNFQRLNFVQNSAYLNSQLSFYSALGNLTSSLSSYFKSSRRLQASQNSNSTVATTPSSNGQDVSSNGKNSGAATNNYSANNTATSSTQIITGLAAALLAILFA